MELQFRSACKTTMATTIDFPSAPYDRRVEVPIPTVSIDSETVTVHFNNSFLI